MPQRIVFGKGLGRADVERRSAKRTVLKCPHQRILHDGGATPHVDQHGMARQGARQEYLRRTGSEFSPDRDTRPSYGKARDEWDSCKRVYDIFEEY